MADYRDNEYDGYEGDSRSRAERSDRSAYYSGASDATRYRGARYGGEPSDGYPRGAYGSRDEGFEHPEDGFPADDGGYGDYDGYSGSDRYSREYAPRGDYPPRYTERSGSVKGGILDKLSGLSDKTKINLLLGVCIGVVLLGVVLCVSIQTCGSCSAREDIPVIEQGDGDAGIQDDAHGEVVSITDGTVSVDEALETDDGFVVTVTGADGTYSRTGVKQSEAATLTLSGQDQTGFSFVLTVNGGTLNGNAYFNGADTAQYEMEGGAIYFSFGSSGVTIYQTAPVSAFGEKLCDGIYATGTPVYTDAAAETASYDADIRTTDATRDTLRTLLGESDYTLMNDIFAEGTSPVYQGAAGYGKDKNGKDINIDVELDAVKYYAFVDHAGQELVLICENDGKVYIGLCDGIEYRYYTNDPAYKTTAPKSISAQAQIKGLTLVYK